MYLLELHRYYCLLLSRLFIRTIVQWAWNRSMGLEEDFAMFLPYHSLLYPDLSIYRVGGSFSLYTYLIQAGNWDWSLFQNVSIMCTIMIDHSRDRSNRSYCEILYTKYSTTLYRAASRHSTPLDLTWIFPFLGSAPPWIYKIHSIKNIHTMDFALWFSRYRFHEGTYLEYKKNDIPEPQSRHRERWLPEKMKILYGFPGRGAMSALLIKMGSKKRI